jgi:nucleolar protein 56
MHNKYIFTNVIGTFVFNEHFNVIDKKLFKNNEQYDNKDGEKEFLNKYKNLRIPEGKELSRILEFFKKIDHFKGFYEGNLRLAKASIKASVKDDLLIIQTISNMSEIDKSINMLVKRLREWYAMYNPEFEDFLQNHEKFVELVLGKSKKELLKEIKVNIEGSMGADLSKEDLEPVIVLAKEVKGLYSLKEKQGVYLEKLMKKVCPNLLAITGATIGAKLIGQAGDLKRLMLFPASTIQLLGAEKALFRHMKTKARAPKYGFLHEHPLISKNKRPLHGKIARALADKISIAVKVDYFKGKFIGDKLLKEIESKFK